MSGNASVINGKKGGKPPIELKLYEESFIVWKDELTDGNRTAEGEVIVQMQDQYGRMWSGSRVVKVRVTLDETQPSDDIL